MWSSASGWYGIELDLHGWMGGGGGGWVGGSCRQAVGTASQGRRMGRRLGGGGEGASGGQCVSRYSPLLQPCSPLLPPCRPLLTAALCCCAATLCADVPPFTPPRLVRCMAAGAGEQSTWCMASTSREYSSRTGHGKGSRCGR